jgi:hypothetical protein
LAGYYNLPTTSAYHSLQLDPTLDVSLEADAIRACHSYIVGPVNMVLGNNPYYNTQRQPYSIRSISEDVHTIQTEGGKHVIRVDLSWQVMLNTVWHTFAIVEFKRPGALDQADWIPALRGTGPVKDQGEKICRQLVKYGRIHEIRYVAACTWDAMILLYLGGAMNAWYGGDTEVRGIPAACSWLNLQTDMKRHLFVFLRIALRVFLSEKTGVQVS